MRKLVLGFVALAIFVSGVVVGLAPAQTDAATCYYACKCVGAAYVPHKCCLTDLGEVCKPDPSAPFACPQIACRSAE